MSCTVCLPIIMLTHMQVNVMFYPVGHVFLVNFPIISGPGKLIEEGELVRLCGNQGD